MFTARKKIAKEKGQEPDSFEESVAQVSLGFAAQCMPKQRQHEATCVEHSLQSSCSSAGFTIYTHGLRLPGSVSSQGRHRFVSPQTSHPQFYAHESS